MTKEEMRIRRKYRIIDFMRSTARHNGKELSYSEAVAFANRLHRLEATLSRLAEDQCNRPVYDEAKQERIENLAERLITETLGCKCYTQRDPRGFAIRMYLVDEDGNKYFNSWDGETTGLDW